LSGPCGLRGEYNIQHQISADKIMFSDCIVGDSRDLVDYINQSSPVMKFLRFTPDKGFKDLHPGWFVHLYFADIYAAMFLSQIEVCQGHSTVPSHDSGAVLQSKTWNLPRATSDMTPAHIPQFGGKSATDMCIGENVVRIDARDRKTWKNGTVEYLPLSEQDYENAKERIKHPGSSNNWKFAEDRPTKFGWIAENPANATTDSDRNPSSIQFTFPTPKGYATSVWLFKLYFMRTYSDAGKAKVFLCGDRIFFLDALWKKHESVPVMEHIILQGGPGPYRDPSCDGNKMTVKITHRPNMNPLVYELESPQRRHEKIKIIGFEMCETIA
jgi:hypothetical protein